MTSVLICAREWSEAFSTASSFLSIHSSSVSFPLTDSMLESEDTAAETKRVSGCLQDELTSEAFELGREEGTGEEMEGEGEGEGERVTETARSFAVQFPSRSDSPSSISKSGEDKGTAACESEFGCTQDASTIIESDARTLLGEVIRL